MTETQAREIVENLYAQEHLYILLSTSKADLEKGVSVPYVGQLPNGERILIIFTDIELAKNYIDSVNMEVYDDIYPIAEITSELDNIFATANALSISCIDFNPDSDNAFGCQTSFFMDVNNIDKTVSTILSKSEVEETINTSTVPARFNPLKIVDFIAPNDVSGERFRELINYLFTLPNYGIQYFSEHSNVHELSTLIPHIITQLIRQAKDNNKNDDVAWFNGAVVALNRLLISMLDETPYLYTLVDNEAENLFLRGNASYIFYTGRYCSRLNMENAHYKRLDSLSHFKEMLSQNSVEQVVITDGPHAMHVVSINNFL